MILDTLETLCCLDGVSGCEDEVRDYILERVMPFADEIRTDAMGNLIVFKKGGRKPQKRVLHERRKIHLLVKRTRCGLKTAVILTHIRWCSRV